VHRLAPPLLALAATLALAAAPARAAAPSPSSSWAAAEIELASAHGIFDGAAARFRPDAPLTRGDLDQALARLTGRPASLAADDSTAVTIAQLDAALVRALGLGRAATRMLKAARAAGLAPPGRFGTEAVARLLGLRPNHPAADDALELAPDDVATQAELAYSAARLLTLAGATSPDAADTPAARRTAGAAIPAKIDVASAPAVAYVDGLASAFDLPLLEERQRRVLATAVSYVGDPYVWGGTGEAGGGFDCSGLVWRVFKLTAYPDEPALPEVLRGRTTMAMSAEIPRHSRIGLDALEPGDVLFFGRGPRSKPAQIDHAGIYLGGGWLINSSSEGVSLAPLEGWYRETFAWARRPLAEAAPPSGKPAV
jgi:cell wall-associated NlpC family hydrolase